jgi:hypothetical protein
MLWPSRRQGRGRGRGHQRAAGSTFISPWINCCTCGGTHEKHPTQQTQQRGGWQDDTPPAGSTAVESGGPSSCPAARRERLRDTRPTEPSVEPRHLLNPAVDLRLWLPAPTIVAEGVAAAEHHVEQHLHDASPRQNGCCSFWKRRRGWPGHHPERPAVDGTTIVRSRCASSEVCHLRRHVGKCATIGVAG